MGRETIQLFTIDKKPTAFLLFQENLIYNYTKDIPSLTLKNEKMHIITCS